MVNTITRTGNKMNDNLDRFDLALSEFQIELNQKQKNQFLILLINIYIYCL